MIYDTIPGINNPAFSALFLALIIWSIVWKGIALWKAARLYHRNWFVWLLVINAFGLLEIFYIYWVAKPAEEKLGAKMKDPTDTTQ